MTRKMSAFRNSTSVTPNRDSSEFKCDCFIRCENHFSTSSRSFPRASWRLTSLLSYPAA